MTKLKLGLAAGLAAVLAFGVAACGQTTATTEAPAAEATPAEVPATDAMAPATDAMAPATEATTEATTPAH
ncbi:MAG: hypothetical protein AB7L65_02315 [Hyphomonadaceae bacterium]